MTGLGIDSDDLDRLRDRELTILDTPCDESTLCGEGRVVVGVDAIEGVSEECGGVTDGVGFHVEDWKKVVEREGFEPSLSRLDAYL
jgi:hypothetical protein